MENLVNFFLGDYASEYSYLVPVVIVLVSAFAIGTSFELIPTMLISFFGGRTKK